MEKLDNQGEPVALPERKGRHLRYDTLMPTLWKGWNACLDEIAKLGPLYTHADPGEVERLTEQLAHANHAIAYAARQAEEKQKVTDALMADAKQFRAERDTLRAQLAERVIVPDGYAVVPIKPTKAMRDACRVAGKVSVWDDMMVAALSASAEPSAREAAALAAEKALGVERLPAEQSAPVERDERALPGWLTVDAERVTVHLSRPSEANGVQVDSLSLRAPTVRDICNAQAGGAGDDAQSELNLFASLAEVGVKDLEGLALKDYSRLQTGYFRLVQDDYCVALDRKP